MLSRFEGDMKLASSNFRSRCVHTATVLSMCGSCLLTKFAKVSTCPGTASPFSTRRIKLSGWEAYKSMIFRTFCLSISIDSCDFKPSCSVSVRNIPFKGNQFFEFSLKIITRCINKGKTSCIFIRTLNGHFNRENRDHFFGFQVHHNLLYSSAQGIDFNFLRPRAVERLDVTPKIIDSTKENSIYLKRVDMLAFLLKRYKTGAYVALPKWKITHKRLTF